MKNKGKITQIIGAVVDVNFENLLEAWSAPNPRDHFYMKVFGKTYAEKMGLKSFQG